MQLSADMMATVNRMLEQGRATQVMIPAEDDCPLFTERPLSQSEAEFSRMVIGAAQARGWFVAHFRPARTLNPDGSTGWRTPVEADGAGFVDLVLVKHTVLFIELKSNNGRQSAAQRRWASRLNRAGANYFLIRPRQWRLLIRLLDGEEL